MKEIKIPFKDFVVLVDKSRKEQLGIDFKQYDVIPDEKTLTMQKEKGKPKKKKKVSAQ